MPFIAQFIKLMQIRYVYFNLLCVCCSETLSTHRHTHSHAGFDILLLVDKNEYTLAVYPTRSSSKTMLGTRLVMINFKGRMDGGQIRIHEERKQKPNRRAVFVSSFLFVITWCAPDPDKCRYVWTQMIQMNGATHIHFVIYVDEIIFIILVGNRAIVFSQNL